MVHDVILSKENISLFIKHQEEKGLKAETIKSYERNLMALFDFLPDNKKVTQKGLDRWVTQMIDDGISTFSLNHRISTCNNYLTYVNRYDLRLTPQCLPVKSSDDILTRNEYIRLLSTAKTLEDERCYFLIRAIASTGIHISDVDKITVEFLISNDSYLTSYSGEAVRFPQIIKDELLAYVKRVGIYKGPVFVAQNNKCWHRASMYCSIVSVCHEARIPEHKATPIKLRQFYLKTYNETTKKFRHLIDKTYDDLIENEQMLVGWN